MCFLKNSKKYYTGTGARAARADLVFFTPRQRSGEPSGGEWAVTWPPGASQVADLWAFLRRRSHKHKQTRDYTHVFAPTEIDSARVFLAPSWGQRTAKTPWLFRRTGHCLWKPHTGTDARAARADLVAGHQYQYNFFCSS